MNNNQFNMQDIMKALMNNPKLYNKMLQEMNQMKIIRSSPTIIEKTKNDLDELEHLLSYFFCMILMDSEKIKIFELNENEIIKINKNDSKIYVNYYDIIKSEVYIDLSLPVKEIKEIIFGQIFYPNFVKKTYKRVQKNQTTENVISNPINEINEEKSLFDYSNFLYLEYKGNKLSNFSKLKEGDILSLKLSKSIYNEINSFPKNKYYKIKFNSILLGYFPTSIKGLPYKKFKKLFNIKNYINSSSVKDDCVPYHLEFLPLGQTIGAGGDCFGGLMFIDPPVANIKQISLSKKAPKWRTISEGLNIFGICENSKCEAYKKEVIFRALKSVGSLPENGMIFNMIENVDNIRCPICNKIIEPDTCGFFKCEYQFIGKKIEDGEVVNYDSKTKETQVNKMDYFEPKGKKKVKWTELKIYVLPIQKIKYELQ